MGELWHKSLRREYLKTMNGGYERDLVAVYFDRYRQIFIQVLSYGLANANVHYASHIKRSLIYKALVLRGEDKDVG